MKAPLTPTEWSPNVILTDADYLDRVAFDLIVNFERMLERRIESGDLCRWLDCVALDGGLRPGENQVQAFFLHEPSKKQFDHFKPAVFADELDAKAFHDNLGEFTLHSFPVESIITKGELFTQSILALGEAEAVERIMVIGDVATYGSQIKNAISQLTNKSVTLFAMEPQTGQGFSQEILGYSLMSALGISGDEL